MGAFRDLLLFHPKHVVAIYDGPAYICETEQNRVYRNLEGILIPPQVLARTYYCKFVHQEQHPKKSARTAFSPSRPVTYSTVVRVHTKGHFHDS